MPMRFLRCSGAVSAWGSPGKAANIAGFLHKESMRCVCHILALGPRRLLHPVQRQCEGVKRMERPRRGPPVHFARAPQPPSPKDPGRRVGQRPSVARDFQVGASLRCPDMPARGRGRVLSQGAQANGLRAPSGHAGMSGPPKPRSPSWSGSGSSREPSSPAAGSAFGAPASVRLRFAHLSWPGLAGCGRGSGCGHRRPWAMRW